MLFHCVRQPTAEVAQIVVSDDVTTYTLHPRHFSAEFAAVLCLLLAGIAEHWERHGDPTRSDMTTFRVDRVPGLPTPIACTDDPGRFGFVLAAEHVTEEGRAAIDKAARVELANWSQRPG